MSTTSVRNPGDDLVFDSFDDDVVIDVDVVTKLIEWCDIEENEKVLYAHKEPGLFINALPDNCKKSYCENVDFYDDGNKYDLIIGIPPCSSWDKWVKHAMKLSDKFCCIMKILNLNEDRRIENLLNDGYRMKKLTLMKNVEPITPFYIVLFEKVDPNVDYYALY